MGFGGEEGSSSSHGCGPREGRGHFCFRGLHQPPTSASPVSPSLIKSAGYRADLPVRTVGSDSPDAHNSRQEGEGLLRTVRRALSLIPALRQGRPPSPCHSATSQLSPSKEGVQSCTLQNFPRGCLSVCHQ